VQPGYGRYAFYGHRRVSGWLQPQVLKVVRALATRQESAGIEGNIAEIGVHHGRLFIGLHLARRSGEHSVAIDLFDDQDRNVDRSGSGNRIAFSRNLDVYGSDGNDVVVVSEDSCRLTGTRVKELAGGGIRLFSVDGGHSAEIVAHDMETAADSLVDGGIVIADDVFNQAWPGVQEGTYRFLTTHDRLVPFAIGFNKTLFTTRESADTYLEAIDRLARHHRWNRKSSVMHSSPVVVVGVPSRTRRVSNLIKMTRSKVRRMTKRGRASARGG
jgi:hypothetical protein